MKTNIYVDFMRDKAIGEIINRYSLWGEIKNEKYYEALKEAFLAGWRNGKEDYLEEIKK